MPETTTFVPRSADELLLYTPQYPNCRLSLVSGQPVMSSSVLAANALFVCNYAGAQMPHYNPDQLVWRTDVFSETKILVTNGTGAQQVTTNSNYDVYGYAVQGRILFAISPAWAGDNTIGTGPFSAERTTVAGIQLNRWDIVGGPTAMRGTYIGSFRTNSTNTVDWQYGGAAAGWQPGLHGLWNNFNRKMVSGFIADTTASWTWTSTAFRPAGGNSTNARVQVIIGVSEDGVTATYGLRTQNANQVVAPLIGIGLDSSVSSAAMMTIGGFTNSGFNNPSAVFSQLIAPGFHFLQPIEAVSAAGSTVTFSAFGATPAFQAGMTYSFMA